MDIGKSENLDEMAVVESTAKHLLEEFKGCNSFAVKHALPVVLEKVRGKVMEELFGADEAQEELNLKS